MTKTSEKIIVPAKKRPLLGKAVKRLRKQGLTPANIYGQDQESIPLILKTNEFQSLLNQHGGELGLVYVDVEGRKEPALTTEISRHPVTGELIHVEFMRVNLKEEVETEVALEVVGEVNVPNTVLEVIRDEIRIKALPEDIPEHIEVDVGVLTRAGDMITIANLKYNKDKITLLVDGDELDKPVVVLQEVKEEVSEVEAEAEVDVGTDEKAQGPAGVKDQKDSQVKEGS